MWNTSGAKYKHFTYNVSRARRKSGEKYTKAVDRYIDLLKKESKQGLTKRIENTNAKAEWRLKKFWIKKEKVNEVLERRWLKDLTSNTNI